VQQKARKAERKSAHQKYVARVMAKKYLDSLREDAHKVVHDAGFMNPTIDNVLHTDVLPWLK